MNPLCASCRCDEQGTVLVGCRSCSEDVVLNKISSSTQVNRYTNHVDKVEQNFCRMIFRRPKSYSITLQRAHSLLKIPRDASSSIREGLSHSSSNNISSSSSLTSDQIQHAFREAAKRHHPDLVAGSSGSELGSRTKISVDTAASKEANSTIRECYEARELLLDYYVRKNCYLHPEIITSTKDKPRERYKDDTWFSVWRNERSFQIEIVLRLSLCLGLAVGTYYHDKYLPERRKQQIQRRDAEFSNFGPRW